MQTELINVCLILIYSKNNIPVKSFRIFIDSRSSKPVHFNKNAKYINCVIDYFNTHTWVFTDCPSCLECNIYSLLCHFYGLMIFDYRMTDFYLLPYTYNLLDVVIKYINTKYS